jgi:hypothetical protein
VRATTATATADAAPAANRAMPATGFEIRMVSLLSLTIWSTIGAMEQVLG